MSGCNKLKEVFVMKTKDLPEIAAALYEKLKADGYSATVLDNTRWILGHFGNYCLRNGIPEITPSVAAVFVQDCFGFDYYNLTARMQSVLRRPLMILIEFEESGNYLKTHQKAEYLRYQINIIVRRSILAKVRVLFSCHF